MRKPRLILFFSLILLVGCSGSAEVKIAPLTMKDFAVGNINLGQPINDVIKMYGSPLKIGESELYKNGDGNLFERYYYKGFELEVNKVDPKKKKVDTVLVFGSGLRTPRKIQVGNATRDVLLQYGRPGQKDRSAFTYSYEETQGYIISEYCLRFELSSDKVKRIIIYIAEQ